MILETNKMPEMSVDSRACQVEILAKIFRMNERIKQTEEETKVEQM